MTNRLVKALRENRAETDPAHADPRLRGRTYPVPFHAVWIACLENVRAEHRWTLTLSDDQTGTIRAEAVTRFLKAVDDITISVGLDEDAQTRVDMISQSRVGRGDLGANARRIARYFDRLDRSVSRWSPAGFRS